MLYIYFWYALNDNMLMERVSLGGCGTCVRVSNLLCMHKHTGVATEEVMVAIDTLAILDHALGVAAVLQEGEGDRPLVQDPGLLRGGLESPTQGKKEGTGKKLG